MTPKIHKKKIYRKFLMSKQGVKNCVFFLIAKNASSDKKYRSKRKDKILFILLSNTLMKKKFQKINFFGGYGLFYNFFFDKSPFLGILLPFIDGGW